MTDCNIRVVCRFRPVSRREQTYQPVTGCPRANVVDERTVVVTRDEAPDITFTFDRAFDANATQIEVYEDAAKATIEDVLNGYNGTLLAYGQTGAGKTHTMFGPDIHSPELRGIIPRACSHLFEHMRADDEGTEYTVKCSFLEIYQERIRDLLNPESDKLRIREQRLGEVYVEGLVEEYTANEQEVHDLLALGAHNRAVAQTRMSEVSSRSHSLFVLTIQQRCRDGSIKTGKLNLVDLAGSERISKTGATGNVLQEAKSISKSLSSLGNVIHSLTSPKAAHVPYRDSKLTRLLQESLGGNAKTTLICACSPHEANGEETLSTLRFGNRAKAIKNSVRANRQRSASELANLVSILKAELSRMKRYAASLEAELRLVKGSEWVPPRQTTAEPAAESEPSASPLPSPGRAPRVSAILGDETWLLEAQGRLASQGVQEESQATARRIQELKEELEQVEANAEHVREKLRKLKEENAMRKEAERTLRQQAEMAKTNLSHLQGRFDLATQAHQLEVTTLCMRNKELETRQEELQKDLENVRNDGDSNRRLIKLVVSLNGEEREKLIESIRREQQIEVSFAAPADAHTSTPAVAEEPSAATADEAASPSSKQGEYIAHRLIAELRETVSRLTRRVEEERSRAGAELMRAACEADRAAQAMAEAAALRSEKQQLVEELELAREEAKRRGEEAQRNLKLAAEAEEAAKRRRGRKVAAKPVRSRRVAGDVASSEEMHLEFTAPMADATGPVTKEGWLLKRSGLDGDWKKRWFVLMGAGLYFFEDESKHGPKGCVLLPGCLLASADEETQRPHSFALKHDTHRTYWFQAPGGQQDMEAWVGAMSKSIHDALCPDATPATS